MNLDLGSFAFGSYLKNGTGTLSWGTSLGQSKPDYKFTYPGAETIIIGMVYCAVPLNTVSLPLGKGGRIYQASELEECQLTSLFRKVYINGIRVDYPFIMVLIKENSDSHSGRRSIKYSDKNAYQSGNVQYSNQEFLKHARTALKLTDNACWFIYSFEAYNQDELHMSAVIVNDTNSITYENSSTRRNDWIELIPKDEILFKKDDSLSKYDVNNIQVIYYGAPGTGKSNTIKRQTDVAEKDGRVIRTTFHPDSDYSTFVGAYKPTTIAVPMRDVTGKVIYEKDKPVTENRIVYEFVPQAFLKAYTGAWKNQMQPFFLIIEEINRGNCAQIFGDLFQLLDRNNEGESDYPISPDEDIQKFLLTDKKYGFAELTEEQVAAIPEEIRSGELLKLPKNLHIWATMNTSDQSLFPIDSAFKRRWDWKYIPIKKHDEGYIIKIGEVTYDWWGFLEKINQVIDDSTSSEDKKLGYFFVKAEDKIISAEKFVGKVLFYLWNDVFKNYGFDNPIFSKGDNKKFTFSDFFQQDGTPDVAMVKNFLKKLDETINKDKSFEKKPDENVAPSA